MGAGCGKELPRPARAGGGKDPGASWRVCRRMPKNCPLACDPDRLETRNASDCANQQRGVREGARTLGHSYRWLVTMLTSYVLPVAGHRVWSEVARPCLAIPATEMHATVLAGAGAVGEPAAGLALGELP